MLALALAGKAEAARRATAVGAPFNASSNNLTQALSEWKAQLKAAVQGAGGASGAGGPHREAPEARPPGHVV